MSAKEEGHPQKTALNKTSEKQDTKDDTDLSRKKADRIAYYRAGVPPKYLKMYDRVISGKGTPRQAIRLQCLACWGWSKSDAADCGGQDCTLYPYNPFHKPVKPPTEPLEQSGTDEQEGTGL